ncbi:MFS transporter [Kocuria sp. HSID16901]|uniref:MFS transporter n=1 Tax=Kocuria sp. HSID16901 TaxID=2419505 RepID=UPI000F87D7C6|nr:MFS transporter [Kocuria sp. HSID16901]RUQ22415.1 MFS transporter [Kocuria sp. HSID16901]
MSNTPKTNEPPVAAGSVTSSVPPAPGETGTNSQRSPESTIDRLRLLTGLAGLGYLAISVFARLPVAMLPLGTLIMIVTWTNEIILGGFAAGVVAISIAIVVPIYGVVAEKLGQRLVLLLCVLSNAVSIFWLISEAVKLQAPGGGSIPALLASCLVTGATSAPVAALARIRWAGESHRLADRSLLNSSLAFESVADVVATALGAAVTGVATLLWHAHATLLLVAAINLLTVTAFALTRLRHSSAPMPRPRNATEDDLERDRVRRKLMWFPVIGMGTLGLLLGSMQSSLVSLSQNFDSVEGVGLLYAVLGLSSLMAAIAINLLQARTSNWGAWLFWACTLTLVALPATMPGSIPTMALALVFLGVVVGICRIVTDSVATRVTPADSLELVMTSTFAALLAGTGLGLVWGAVLGDSQGYNTALLLPMFSAAAYLLLSHVYGLLWRKYFERGIWGGRHAERY